MHAWGRLAPEIAYLALLAPNLLLLSAFTGCVVLTLLLHVNAGSVIPSSSS